MIIIRSFMMVVYPIKYPSNACLSCLRQWPLVVEMQLYLECQNIILHGGKPWQGTNTVLQLHSPVPSFFSHRYLPSGNFSCDVSSTEICSPPCKIRWSFPLLFGMMASVANIQGTESGLKPNCYIERHKADLPVHKIKGSS